MMSTKWIEACEAIEQCEITVKRPSREEGKQCNIRTAKKKRKHISEV
jgi:hypothetical protein